MTNWFSSDHHFNHANIIRYDKRPYKDVKEMNYTLIANHNAQVQPNDTVYFLGDLGFGSDLVSLIKRLNGKKFLTPGNHDKQNLKNPDFCAIFEKIEKEMEVSINGQLMFLSHYAHRTWNKSHRGSYHLYGHSHGSLADDPNSLSFDVGVNCHNYFPLSFAEVERIMKTKTWKPIDHHGKKDEV
jgi:calcineurin-like phosphoesterase family protein